MSFEELKSSIKEGLIFDKPTVQSAILKVESDGFHYSIGRNGKSKKVTYVVLEKCYEHLLDTNAYLASYEKANYLISNGNV